MKRIAEIMNDVKEAMMGDLSLDLFGPVIFYKEGKKRKI